MEQPQVWMRPSTDEGTPFTHVLTPQPVYSMQRHNGHFRKWVEEMAHTHGPGQYLIMTDECQPRLYLYSAVRQQIPYSVTRM